MKHDVCSLDELTDDGLKEVAIGDLRVLLARDGGRVLATGAVCTHQGGPLKNGARVGNRVICPWHHAMFDLETGDHLQPPGQGCLNRFATSVENGRVLVEVRDGEGMHRPEVRPEDRRSGGSEVFAIVGGGAGGLACAQELVRDGFAGRIVMISAEDEPPYDRTALSKAYLGGKVGDGDLPLVSRDALAAIGVEFMTRGVAEIDALRRTIRFEDGDELAYDKCFASPGSEAGRLDLDNADLPNVLTLRSHADGRRLKEAAAGADEIVILGAGFIGMEVAAALTGLGKHVTVVAREPLPFAARFGDAVAGQIVAQHRAKGVTVLTNSAAASLEAADGRVASVHLSSGERLRADLVLVAVGARPRVGLFKGVTASGGGIEVDQSLKAAESLYLGGDVANFPLHGRSDRARIEHWRVAEQHGRYAARAMLGRQGAYDGVPFFWSAQFGPIHYVGNARSFDEVHVEGDLAAGAYTAFYVKDGKVLAALGRGKGDVTADFHAVMLTDPTPDKALLEAVGWKPKALLGS